jgi:predicted metal-dependent hydrolase/Fe-S-cluster containining protein
VGIKMLAMETNPTIVMVGLTEADKF